MASLQKSIAVSAQRGAWIRIVTGDLQHSESYNWRSISVLLGGSEGALIRPRLRILEVSTSLAEMVHAKCIVADGKRGYLGSANLSVRGLETNFELGVLLDESDATTLDQLVAHFEATGALKDRTQLLHSK
jgi:phosphatidylserine/phosphatidylglycerophosphate/cardiolipin synthase-like enzyme